ncbi:MAG: hypothetical protein A2268_05880 [Candidatus Raymondbacteria bacterium RifOxyA12_full_50_37]|uniref:Uncharacterized protein n=1 Tax=Candidatus Raymondbacteria bacterium RIFOXYD12_FULL_49_13 TaxID=1817890 RepID=A0A1F7FFF6_UNCRA|nr:MAG: hypothetical protein A2268_05880 [Candidatus Raymondbacteria bacterium RifOxyA12_full_50_37]OGJ94269.1 MAG: hypothetical protein A2248_14810 [Candidatus Raymondbacteria bacterium RIFOXYA2_FULL_49_16]OGJ96382.1 MAG: hypothetical protein A2487_00410 [Candidatus Raymondbacteria bacterium RifOxyC12_full_50_8]OGJ99099.1 MAG: hypothetical protein A2453_11220 [Candidatus Raymondbacteria bacterium RIFOXYC2_FULL_50_21]OGK01197.1 MAG: hypothetical protein A2350_01700 [Candidatus Raymondbacteria b
MKESLNKFSARFQEAFLELIWRQWCVLGVQGYSAKPGNQCIDPEALILMTCSVGRREPRLFDEMLDWLVCYQEYVSKQRLLLLSKSGLFSGNAVWAAVEGFLATQKAGAKWRKQKDAPNRNAEPLFILKDGRPMKGFGAGDEVFRSLGFERGLVKLRGMSQPFSPSHPSCLLLRLRALFGTTTRSEIVLFLLTHPGPSGETPSAIARETGYAQKSVHNTLVNMSLSGLVSRRQAGREVRYAIAKELCQSLLLGIKEKPSWLNWASVFVFLESLWILLGTPGFYQKNDSLQSIAMRELWQKHLSALSDSGLGGELRSIDQLSGKELVETVLEQVEEMMESFLKV